MRKNIDLFLNAKFGDKFITRDGNMAIYIQSIDGGHRLLSQQFPSGYTILPNGRFFRDSKREYDIVGRYKEDVFPSDKEIITKAIEIGDKFSKDVEIASQYACCAEMMAKWLISKIVK